MQKAAAALAAGTVLGGAYLIMRAMQTRGSGQGTVTTEDTSEGTIFDMNGIANQITAAATPSPTENPHTMSAAGLAALQTREGFSPTPYPDHKGYSIGFGHLIKPGENITQVTLQQATDLLANDVAWAEASVYGAITVPITQAQFDALVSFAYNVGAPAFERSTLARKINTGDTSASQEFSRWVFASGQVNPALVQRRQGERQQFESGTA